MVVGNNFSDNVFVEDLRIMLEPTETGSVEEDQSKLVLLVREWVKGLRGCEFKNELEKLNDPMDMLPIIETYLNENYI